jgi:hypothetical protein
MNIISQKIKPLTINVNGLIVGGIKGIRILTFQ